MFNWIKKLWKCETDFEPDHISNFENYWLSEECNDNSSINSVIESITASLTEDVYNSPVKNNSNILK